MSVTKKEYAGMTQKASPPSPSYKTYPAAFVVGGLICCLGQLLTDLFARIEGLTLPDARGCTSIVLIFIAAALTALGWFSPIARFAGAGTLVPITGFANAVVSPAMEFKCEGWIFGVGANVFKIAGPVILYGISSSVVYGVVYWLFSML